jgi:hypothetical protein
MMPVVGASWKMQSRNNLLAVVLGLLRVVLLGFPGVLLLGFSVLDYAAGLEE